MTATELSFEEAFASDEFIRNPYPIYGRLLRDAPVWRSPHGKYFVSSHRLCSEILTGHQAFPQPEDPNPSFHAMNPPEHTRLRRMVSRAFTPRATERQRSRIAEIVRDLVDAIQPGTDIDLKQALSVQLPTRMITGLLGVPVEDGALWEEWATALHEATSFPGSCPRRTSGSRRCGPRPGQQRSLSRTISVSWCAPARPIPGTT